jgi:L-threonylcarbamoyladenylate synthase
MKTRIIRVDPAAIDAETICDIARVLGGDGVIVYPTDTFYGLGGNCFSRKVLQEIFEIKRRPAFKGLPVLVSDLEMAEGTAAEFPPLASALAARFWPGPLTMVLKTAPHLPPELVGPAGTIGIRWPAVAWLQRLIREAGFPLITTSANISGRAEIGAPEEVIRLFREKVELIVDGGPAPGGLPSTVVDLTGEKPLIVREGVIGHEVLEKLF